MATNLQFIKSQSITSSVANISITDVFSTGYNVYKIVADITSSGGDSDGSLQFIDTSDNVETGSNYDWAMSIMKGETSFFNYKNTGQTTMTALFHGTEQGSGNTIYVFNPFDSSSYTFVTGQATGESGSNLRGYKNIGVLKLAESMSGFKLTFDVNATSGNISVYGVR
tara:strand:- start:566 stop:1069 length:504 start_codon:yes stop_codon:yes gene_type:complete